MPPIAKTVVGVFAGLLAVFGILAVICRRPSDLGSVSGTWIAEQHKAGTESYDT